MDLNFRGAAPEGGTLRVDVTRREGEGVGRRADHEDGSGGHLVAAERYKRWKYGGRYPAPDMLEGFAVDSFGGVGPGAGVVMRMLAALGAQLTGRAATELLREMEWTVGFVLVRYGAYLEQLAGTRARVACWYPKVRAAIVHRGGIEVVAYKRPRGDMAATVARARAARAMRQGVTVGDISGAHMGDTMGDRLAVPTVRVLQGCHGHGELQVGSGSCNDV